jgi:hypothetical protein
VIAGCAAAASDPSSPRPRGGAPVVLELFTSQGCSSCPPADQQLSAIARAGRVGDRAVIALAFHVDYWDDLGWADPFAQPAWSARQRAYASALAADHVYTPALIVAGGADVIGSNRAGIERAVAAAPAQRPIAATATRAGDRVQIHATAPAAAEVWVALWQDGAVTDVTRGENQGAQLQSDRIVRRLVRVAAAGRDGTAELVIDPAWTHVGAAVFAQRADRTIVGATALTIE